MDQALADYRKASAAADKTHAILIKAEADYHRAFIDPEQPSEADQAYADLQKAAADYDQSPAIFRKAYAEKHKARVEYEKHCE